MAKPGVHPQPSHRPPPALYRITHRRDRPRARALNAPTTRIVPCRTTPHLTAPYRDRSEATGSSSSASSARRLQAPPAAAAPRLQARRLQQGQRWVRAAAARPRSRPRRPAAAAASTTLLSWSWPSCWTLWSARRQRRRTSGCWRPPWSCPCCCTPTQARPCQWGDKWGQALGALAVCKARFLHPPTHPLHVATHHPTASRPGDSSRLDQPQAAVSRAARGHSAATSTVDCVPRAATSIAALQAVAARCGCSRSSLAAPSCPPHGCGRASLRTP